MRSRLTTKHLLCSAVFVSGCTLSQESPVPPLPVPELVMLPAAPVERVEVPLLPRQRWPAPAPTLAPGKKAPPPLSPAQVIAQAQRAARVEPSPRGYFGGSAEHVYSWTPGKVYTIYLSPKQPTGIFLPPGERLVTGLYLSENEYEVKNERAGSDLRAYDAMTIRPLVDKGEVDTFLLTESGRRYLLHLVVGPVGMVAVTFEGPPLHQASPPAQALVLPRPPQ